MPPSMRCVSFSKVKVTRANWQPQGKFLRLVTRSGEFDVLLIKNDDGTVDGMVITKP